jgi:hypothetical protein
MNKRSALLILLLQVAVAGCSTQPKQARPSIESTKVAAPVVVQPTVVYTQNVREVTSKLKIVPGRWKMIICHHSALEKGNAAKYDKDHRRRGMENGLAYHFVIGNGVDSGDGEIEIGSRWISQIKGGHVRDDAINEVAIGICVVGNLEEKAPTENQIAALKELLAYLHNEAVGPQVVFKVHCEADPNHTACPGKFFPTEAMRSIFNTPAGTQLKPAATHLASPRRT